jgi:L-threonylcarbamoyladenylate synthase
MEMLQTQIWHVDKDVNNYDVYPQIAEAAQWIGREEVIAFPTETVYGLGADVFSSSAVKKIFRAKGRPSDNPLIIHIADLQQLKQLVSEISLKASRLMEEFWPGPLTLIMPSLGGIAPEVTAGLRTVGIRMPAHPVALRLIRQANTPIAAPSANRSGRPSPTTAAHVFEDLQGKIVGILDGGPTGVGVESTVIDMTDEPPTILRPGGITQHQIERVIGPVIVDPGLLADEDNQQPKSPGMKYRHYAPEGEMWVVAGDTPEQRAAKINMRLQEAQSAGKKVGVLATVETQAAYPQADLVLVCGSRRELTSVARNLYDVLRQFDSHQVDYIIAESFPYEGVGAAIMNRLLKASSNRVF